MASEPLVQPDLVSVIVTTRNAARVLGQCLLSIREQGQQVEVIVVDNGSTDETLQIAARFADVVEMVGPERSAQRNHGARVAQGSHLLFIDADMVLTRGVVADCLSTMHSTASPAVIVPEDSIGNGFWAQCRALERSCYTGDDQVEAARFYRREVFQDSGGFDESLTGPEDWDLSRRVALGRRLPRTAARIQHLEGHITLRGAFAKKRYYASGYLRYLHKHGRNAVGQGNVLFRPAFLRHVIALSRNPLLAAGILCLKAVELSAVLLVAIQLGLRLGPSPGAGGIYARRT
jgi:arabinofuranan 3-O-arabinosyltransferase